MKYFYFIAIISVSSFTYSQTAGSGITDIDGNSYATAIYGGEEFMTENLVVTRYSNGDTIPEVLLDFDWQTSDIGAWCSYANDTSYVADHGRIYNWFAVDDSRNICPAGWRVPSDENYTALADLFGGLSNTSAANSLKTTGTIQAGTGLWNDPNSGDNTSNFSAIPGGTRNEFGVFNGLGDLGDFWTSGAADSFSAWFFTIGSVAEIGGADKRAGKSVRCMKGGPIGLIELTPLNSPRKLVKITDLMGREIEISFNTPMLFIFSDGSVERIFKLEY